MSDMRRRAFITLLGGVVAWPLAARAQQGAVPVIGYLSARSPAGTAHLVEAFRRGLGEPGFFEGHNVTIEYGWAFGHADRLPELAANLVRKPVNVLVSTGGESAALAAKAATSTIPIAFIIGGDPVELVGRDVDVIIAPSTAAARAARQATTTIPIVAFALGDAVADGLVSSLARPGGNVTGLAFLAPELTAKRLQLFKDVVPTLSRVAGLWDPGTFGERTSGEMLKTSEAAAAALGVQLQMIAIRSHEELDSAFSAMIGDRIEAVFVFPGPLFFSAQQRIAALALRH